MNAVLESKLELKIPKVLCYLSPSTNLEHNLDIPNLKILNKEKILILEFIKTQSTKYQIKNKSFF